MYPQKIGCATVFGLNVRVMFYKVDRARRGDLMRDFESDDDHFAVAKGAMGDATGRQVQVGLQSGVGFRVV